MGIVPIVAMVKCLMHNKGTGSFVSCVVKLFLSPFLKRSYVERVQ
jgi:hypothetical protein